MLGMKWTVNTLRRCRDASPNIVAAGLLVVLALTAVDRAAAGDNCLARKWWCVSTVPMCWLPDDYCAKPMPCVPCPSAGRHCDDYCGKPMPCVPCPSNRWLCDDYGRKVMPCVPCLSKCGCNGHCTHHTTPSEFSTSCETLAK